MAQPSHCASMPTNGIGLSLPFLPEARAALMALKEEKKSAKASTLPMMGDSVSEQGKYQKGIMQVDERGGEAKSIGNSPKN